MKKLFCNILNKRNALKLIPPVQRSSSPLTAPNPALSFTRTYASIKRPIVIGGSNVDIVATLLPPTVLADIPMDGRMVSGTISQCRGGVGRNIGDALAKLNTNPLLITAVGNDEMGQFLTSGLKHMDTKGVLHCKQEASASCCVIVDQDGECKFIIGNMNIHANISLHWIQKFEQDLINASFIVFDGNLKPDAINYILQICHIHNIPVWFEPTDIAVCSIIKSTQWTSITHLSPNFNELKHMTSALTGNNYSHINPTCIEEFINESVTLAKHFPTHTLLMVTLGRHGMVLICGDSMNYYEALPVDNIVNVSGAGDCAVAGYIAAQLSGNNEMERVSAALSCAWQSLMSSTPVPTKLSRKSKS
uniref:Pseudouridine kinase n=1 Tax=Cacopsylla melanoneura TaxID=428564 RepID=A0A8D8WFB9_9HEMI